MHVSPAQLDDALVTVDFPTDKEAILRHAREAGAPEDVVQALRSLPPEVRYANKDEVARSLPADMPAPPRG